MVDRVEYRKAAALLTSFDPTLLRRPGGESVGGAVLQPVDDCETRGGRAGPAWSLRPDVREQTLMSFSGPDDALRTLQENIESRPEHGTERAALAYLRGQAPTLEAADIDTLCHIREAVGWLSLVPGMTGLPAEDDIAQLLESRRLLEPLESLLRHRFEGRTRELERLRAHVGVLPPRRGAEGHPDTAGRSPGGPAVTARRCRSWCTALGESARARLSHASFSTT